MEYVYGTAAIDGVTRENLKIVGGQELQDGEYLTTVRSYGDTNITDRCRIGRHYHTATDAAGTRYDWYVISEHYRYVDKAAAVDALTTENKTLKQQVSALTEQQSFYEDCIAEMAAVVYA